MRNSVITAKISRACRGFLSWSRKSLNENSGVPERTIARFEEGTVKTSPQNLEKIRDAFREKGIIFEIEDEYLVARLSNNYEDCIIIPKESKACRGFLNWLQEDLAKQTRLHTKTIASFENYGNTLVRNLEDIKAIFEKEEGIEFKSDGKKRFVILKEKL